MDQSFSSPTASYWSHTARWMCSPNLQPASSVMDHSILKLNVFLHIIVQFCNSSDPQKNLNSTFDLNRCSWEIFKNFYHSSFHQCDLSKDDSDVNIVKKHTTTFYELYFLSCMNQSTWSFITFLCIYSGLKQGVTREQKRKPRCKKYTFRIICSF